jgi:proteasome lid subunit RPN8/RPN11
VNQRTVKQVLNDRQLLAEMLDWARACAPEECVGLISRGPHSLTLWRAHNAAEDPLHSFQLTPGQQKGLLQHIALARHELIGLLHSHPNGDAEPSATDLEIAAGNFEVLPHRLVWAIVGLNAGEEQPEISAQLLP